MRRIERHVRVPGLRYTEHGDDFLDRALHAERDARARCNAKIAQSVRQRSSAPIELRVGQRKLTLTHRDRVRRSPHLRREQLQDGHGALHREPGSCVVARDQRARPLAIVHQSQPRYPTVGIIHDVVEHRQPLAAHALDRSRIEQIAGVGDPCAQDPGDLPHRERQIEGCVSRRDTLQALDLEARQTPLDRCSVVKSERCLKQRIAR